MWKLWRLGKIFGIEIKLHGTMLLLALFYVLSGAFSGGAAMAALNLALGVMVFGVVLLHELGHMAAYRRYGLKAHDILLTPLGGIARGLGSPKTPWQEFVIAAAGPAVNVVLGLLAYLALLGLPWQAMGGSGAVAAVLTRWFVGVNVTLLLFNLIPALPMDGGRMLRAALTPKLGFLRATQLSAKIARWSTLGMALLGLYLGSLSMLLIAGMIYMLSWVELAQAQVAQAARNPIFGAFRGFSANPGAGPHRGGGSGATVVDQYGQPVGGGGPRSGWSSVDHVQPTADGRGWTVSSVRWLED